MARKPKQARRGGQEYRFKIDAWTPDRIPMCRLAEYMQQLAQVLGEPTQVHFVKLVRGSTIIVHAIEQEAVPKVAERIRQVRGGSGPSEALRAYAAANKLLREDDAVGTLKNGRIVLNFPGRDERQEEYVAVRQHGSVDGIITGVRGKDETAHITLQIEDQQVSGCWTNRTIAKELAKLLWEPVRLFGRGKWQRDDEGVWKLLELKIESFQSLDNVTLSEALTDLRRIHTQWDDNAYKELEVIRHGQKGNGNGGS